MPKFIKADRSSRRVIFTLMSESTSPLAHLLIIEEHQLFFIEVIVKSTEVRHYIVK